MRRRGAEVASMRCSVLVAGITVVAESRVSLAAVLSANRETEGRGRLGSFLRRSRKNGGPAATTKTTKHQATTMPTTVHRNLNLESSNPSQTTNVSNQMKSSSNPTPSEQQQISFAAGRTKGNGPPCACESANTAWKPPTARGPMCFFLDVGAGSGDSELAFLGESGGSGDYYGTELKYDTGNWPKKECLSYLVEPNKAFEGSLNEIAKKVPGKIFPMVQQAVYMCDKEQELFHLDTQGPHARGSAIDSTHADIFKQSESQRVPTPVKLINLMRWLKEGVLPEDHLVLKLDVEGAEWDILPCLAQSPEIYKLIDVLYLEDHCPGGQYCCFDGIYAVKNESCNPAPMGQCWCPSKGMAGNTFAQFRGAIETLKAAGVKFPAYFSAT
ncbi:unnamed protein product [Amoebophrya sp. A25]|nr:unnamed protein product [Amoebophrya sp. A25]|eukprot:GSA25T00015960001.1